LSHTTEILIGDVAGSHVLITPLGRSQPGLFDERDGNGIDCEVNVTAGAFHGTFRASVRSEEVRMFLDDLGRLARTLDGAATLTALEGQLRVSLTAGESESIAVTGDAIDEPGGGNALRFAFPIERSGLDPLCRSVEHLLAAYPVNGAMDALPGRGEP
jgi:hypothetical protein